MPKRTTMRAKDNEFTDEAVEDMPIEQFRIVVLSHLCRIVAERDHCWQRCPVALCRRSHVCHPKQGFCAARSYDESSTEEELNVVRNRLTRFFREPEVIAFCRQGEQEELARSQARAARGRGASRREGAAGVARAAAAPKRVSRIDRSDQQS